MTCPRDADHGYEAGDRCRKTGGGRRDGWTCTRPRGHAGSHHSHSYSSPHCKAQCFWTWPGDKLKSKGRLWRKLEREMLKQQQEMHLDAKEKR